MSPLDAPRPNRHVGQPVERIEDLRLLRGAGLFADDVTRPSLLHAAILRSPVAHGRIRGIELAAARDLPGVVAVITAETLGGEVPGIPMRLAPLPELAPYWQPVIADRKVRYVGEPVAVVVAESATIAEDALELIGLDIAPLPAVVDTAAARQGATLLFETAETNQAILYTARKGEAEAEFPGARVVRARMETQRHTALTMEPRGLLAEWDAAAGRLRVIGAAKVPFASRGMLARQLGLPEESIELIEVDVGGGFGMRGEFYPEDFLVPFAARLTGRPVKWIEDRREHLQAANHAREFDAQLELVCRPDGTILALRGHINANLGAYMRANVAIAPRNVAQFLSGPYAIPNIHVEVSALVTNKTPTGTYRGPGRFEADFFRERLFDLACAELGLDRVDFRRRNLVPAEALPYPLATVSPPEKAEMLDSGDYAMTLERCLAEIGWAEKQALQGRLVEGRYHGLGIGCFIEGGAAGPRERARAELVEDGTVAVHVGSTLVGQGLETVLTQIAADAMECAMDVIRLFHGSTTYVPEGFGSFHSRSTVMGGTAIMLAIEELRGRMRAAAARRLGCEVGAVRLEEGRAVAPDGRALGWAELAAEGVSGEGVFANHTHTYSYGAAAAHVAVDPRTGHVAVLDYVTVEDVGRMINPLLLQGQVIGGTVQGLGGVFLEHLVYDAEGQLLTGSLADYLLPTATDFPSVRAVVMGVHASPISPLGAKGAGEGGTIPVGGVIANAVAAAFSGRVQPLSLPLSPPRVWEMIRAAG
ncbi:MAG TPA: xanthine dehydrogenase family protein molybdopterin-binding subunit [Crenalkalicoccus sp.]|nr:xanthine dehydrogenase family protein molybdopterin-binding subunit [Crenalkalicoccus sp.]